MRFYKLLSAEETFDPEAHRWLAVLGDGRALYVMKDTDRWTEFSRKGQDFKHVLSSQVPVAIRKRAGQRLGGLRSSERMKYTIMGRAPTKTIMEWAEPKMWEALLEKERIFKESL